MINRVLGQWILWLFLPMFIANTGHARTDAILETGLQIDNKQYNDSKFSINHYGLINNKSEEKNRLTVLDYQTQSDDVVDYNTNNQHKHENRINQLYVQYDSEYYSTSAMVGRFYRIDSLGFYTLDGINVIQDKGNYKWRVYGGVPSRTDDIYTDEFDSLYGSQFSIIHMLDDEVTKIDYKRIDENTWYQPPSQVVYRVEYQRLNQSEENDYLTTGIHYKKNHTHSFFSRNEILINTRYELVDGNTEDMIFEWASYTQNNSHIRLSYDYYQPTNDNASFREKFYSRYALGEQHLAELSFYQQVNRALSTSLGLRRTGNKSLLANNSNGQGNGYRFGFDLNLPNTLILSFEYSVLTLMANRVESSWLRASKFINSKNRLIFEGGLQYEHKILYGNNDLVGSRVNWRYMINGDLFLTISAEYLSNSNKKDSHLYRGSLTYYFSRGKKT